MAYIFIGDFSKFFDKLQHRYLKEKIRDVIGTNSLDAADYAIYKNITKFAYVEADDIESVKGEFRRDMRNLEKYFETDEFHNFKKEHLYKNIKDYQIPQGSSISAVYANVYMVDFDKRINDFITSRKRIYRRYCDDIIVVVPMTRDEIINGKNKEIADFIYKTRDDVPNLELNEDKVEHFFYKDGENSKSKLGGLCKMETSVLIQVPYELESVYSPLEERTDIDYTVMSVDNFNVGDFLIGLYITISSNSVITGVV